MTFASSSFQAPSARSGLIGLIGPIGPIGQIGPIRQIRPLRPIRTPHPPLRNPHSAFTLTEILIAMAIATFVIVGMSTLLFSMGELWGQNSDRRLFDLHVRNVTRFLENELAAASLPPTGGAAGSQTTTTNTAATRAANTRTNTRAGSGASTSTSANPAPVTIQEIRDQAGNTENYITYELPNGSRLCFWPERALPSVVCSLAFREGQGLFLLWHSRLEINFEVDAPRETLITPLVTGISYDYYDPDTKAWKTETALLADGASADQIVLPQRIRLQFTYGTLSTETMLDIPGPPVQGQPML